MTWVSRREAARILADEAGLARPRADRVLTSGLAGEPVRTAAAHLFDADRVRGLARRPVVDGMELGARFAGGVFVARRDLDLRAGEDERRAQVASGWDFSLWVALMLDILVRESGWVPLVATTCGFVTVGGDIVGVAREPTTRAGTLTVRRPGAWFEPLRAARVATGPGAPWWMSQWRPFARPSPEAPRLEQ
jgi:hypothetical protein